MTLSARDLSVRFGGLQALAEVSLEVTPGRILGLIGPNGAGKTTLFNCLTGVIQPKGTVVVDGVEITQLRTDERVRRGISRTFQTPRLDMNRTVLDAVMLGYTPHLAQGRLACFLGLPSVRRREEHLRNGAIEKIRLLGLGGAAEDRAGSLSLGQLRLLEVARALVAGPRYLLLDEPAAGLDESDRIRLADAIKNAAASGIGIVLIEHNVGFVSRLSHELLALVNGTVVARGEPNSVVCSEKVVEAYLGPAYVH